MAPTTFVSQFFSDPAQPERICLRENAHPNRLNHPDGGHRRATPPERGLFLALRVHQVSDSFIHANV